MTMHLERGLSTIRTTKPQQKKLTKTQHKKLKEELRLKNKSLKQQGRHSEILTFEEYVEYVYGKAAKAPKAERQMATEVKTFKWQAPRYLRETKTYASHSGFGSGVAAKAERKEYTGTLVKGIATMHKSNAVPVISDEEAESISKMRRN